MRGRIVTVLVGLGFFALFVVGVQLFRSGAAPEESQETIADVLTADPIVGGLTSSSFLEGKDAELVHVVTEQSLGRATRGLFDGRLSVTVNHNALELDHEAFFYEVWLVRKLPFSFLSIGEMIPLEEGGYQLEWESDRERDYREYSRVIVTRETRGSSRDPETHILEGEFGK